MATKESAASTGAMTALTSNSCVAAQAQPGPSRDIPSAQFAALATNAHQTTVSIWIRKSATN